MKPHLKRIVAQAGIIMLTFLAAAGLQALAYSEPVSAPPGGNFSSPINTGSAIQTKTGGLVILGNVGIGTSTPAGSLDVDNPSHTATFCLNGTCMTSISGGGGGGSYLAGGSAHRTTDCALAGGTLYTISGTTQICQFSAASCPGGWGLYQSWTQTASNYCADGTGCGNCTTSSHTFANASRESCPFTAYGPEPPCTGFSCTTGTCGGSGTCDASVTKVGCI